MKKPLLLLIFSMFFVSFSSFAETVKSTENSKVHLTAECVNPSASYEVVSNCQFGEQFLIETTIDDLGDASAVTVSDNMGSTPQTVSAVGDVVTFGPYPNGTNVVVTVASADDDSCQIQSGNLTQTYCPTGYISVDDSYSAEELVNFLIDNPCAMVSNVTSSTGTDFNDDPGLGYFDGDGTTFPISSGILLSSGNVNNASGPTQNVSDGGINWPGDSDLDALTASLGSTSGTNNASIIEFDFVPFTDHISFDYLFASSEYGTFQCTFADVFAFFLTDSDGNTQNLAVIPGTDTPVSAITIRDNTYNSNCSSVNPEYFDKYYGSPNGLPEEANPITYRGYTVKMTAEADVIPGETYHIKLAIADYSDRSWDSAVFLQAGSFDIGSIDLGPDMTIENQNAPCETQSAILDSGIEDNEFADFSWYHNDELIEGETEPSLEVTEDGTYTVFVIYGGSCVLEDEIYVEFAPVPEFEFENQDNSLCGLDSIVLDGTPNNIEEFQDDDLFYTWFYEGNEIPGETGSSIEVSEPGVYEVEVTTALGCEGSHTFTLSDAGFEVSLGEDLTFCDAESHTITAEVEGDVDGLTFEWEGPGVDGETGQSVTVNQTGVYSVTVISEDCEGTTSVYLEFNESPVFDLGEDISVTDLEDVELNAAPSNFDSGEAHYEWTYNGEPIPEDGPIVYPIDYGFGTYTVVVYGDDPDCYSTQTIEVIEVEIIEGMITEGISPGDNDGINDNFDLTFLNDRSGIDEIFIYNRYGTKVYNRKNYTNEWHGQTNGGKELPSGTYYYVIKLKNEDPEYGRVVKGWVYVNQSID